MLFNNLYETLCQKLLIQQNSLLHAKLNKSSLLSENVSAFASTQLDF